LSDFIEPTFENNGNKYVFSWAEYKLKAEISRIHANHERTTCRLKFTSDHEESYGHLFQDNINLEAGRTRTTLAKEMESRYKIAQEIDWKKLLEYVSVKTLREHEKGEPVVEIWSDEEVKPVDYFLYPIAPLNKPTVLFGDPGSGKSQTATVLGTIASIPLIVNDLHIKAPMASSPPLLLDYEADSEDVKRLLSNIQKGMILSPIKFFYRRCTTPLADEVDAIMQHIEDVGAKLVIVDSVSLAAGGDLNKMDIATSYFSALRKLNITTISLAHTSKDRESHSKTILGSVLFEAGARSVWEIRGQEDDDSLAVCLYHRKSNLSGKVKPLGWRFNYSKDGTTVEWHNPKNISEFVERMGQNDRILHALKSGLKTNKALSEELDIKLSSVNVAITRLKSKNFITGDSKNGWGLLYKE